MQLKAAQSLGSGLSCIYQLSICQKFALGGYCREDTRQEAGICAEMLFGDLDGSKRGFGR